MQTVIVYSESDREGLNLYKALSVYRNFKVQLFDSVRSVEKSLNNSVNCLVYDLGHLNGQAMKTMENFKKLGSAVPIVFTPVSLDAAVIESIRKATGVYVFERPFKDREVLKVVQKVVTGKDVYQRASRRYPTDEVAHIEDLLQNRHIEGIVHNMSKGGVHIACASGSLRVGDLLKLQIELRQLEKSHTVFGEVVWAQDNPDGPGRMGVGVKFVSQEEAAVKMMENRRGKNG